MDKEADAVQGRLNASGVKDVKLFLVPTERSLSETVTNVSEALNSYLDGNAVEMPALND